MFNSDKRFQFFSFSNKDKLIKFPILKYKNISDYSGDLKCF